MYFCAIQLAYTISRNFHCDAIMPVVKLSWCVALEPMTDSKCKPVHTQWTLLKLEASGDVICHKAIVLNGYQWLDKTTFQRRRYSRKKMVATQGDSPLAMSLF